jgi:Protein of unknown function (DUF1592)/Protein of unknown function (DUF1588)/Protein of unknown function (DUF1585)/Planctomycete cytochrome C
MRGCLIAPFLWSSAAVFAQTALSTAVGTYCVTCHNPRLAEAKVELDGVRAQRPWEQADLWERVLRQLRARTMPPADNPRPDEKTYEALVEMLQSALDRDYRPKPAPVTDREIAAHLAKFLWSSAPDAELLDVAGKGRLHEREVLEAQVRRMLSDSKIAGLVSSFFDDWLGLNQLATMPADAATFPEFDPTLRAALKRETELFVESQLREDRPAIELWTAKYTYLSDRLARHYGIPNVTGPEFRRVALEGTERAGLLGQGSFLVATSVLTRHEAVDGPSTSPAARAKWIRIHFLGVPMRNPLPGLPPLLKGVLLSAQLRTLPDPTCDACHQNFLPLGYALENFDPLGRWRAEAENEPVDVSGVLPDGTEFAGPAELRRVLLQRSDAFLTTITERMLAYARAAPAAPMPAVRAVLRDAERGNYTWSSLIAGIAGSGFF